MNTDHSQISFHFSADQLRIYQRLRRLGCVPAAFYRDACRLMADSHYESTTYLVSHLLREIEGSLRDVLGTSLLMDKPGRNTDNAHKRIITAILEALGIPKTDYIANAWLGIAGENNKRRLAARVHRDNLGSIHRVDVEFKQFWADINTLLDIILDRFETQYISVIKVLDALLEKEIPTNGDISQIRTEIPNNPITLGYFFERLSSPHWLKPLYDEEFFRNPPASEKGPDGETIFPPWPQGRYLVHMAPVQPELVAEIIKEMPTNDNIVVVEDMATALLAIPAPLTATFLPHILSWLETSKVGRITEYVANLMKYLAQHGEQDAALSLAAQLWSVVGKTSSWPGDRLVPKPRFYFFQYEYGETFAEYLPDLVDACGLKALLLVCDFLTEALSLEYPVLDSKDCYQDFSHIWRRSIADNRRYYLHDDVLNVLVTAISDTAQQLINAKSASVGQAVDLLEDHKWPVFQRIAIYILTQYADDNSPMVAERILCKKLFNLHGARREYFNLLGVGYKLLSLSEQKELHRWIEEGPEHEEMESFINYYQENEGKNPVKDIVQQYVNRWKSERIRPIYEYLPNEWRNTHPEIVLILEGDDVEESSTWIGPTSPRSIEKLATMSVHDLIRFLQTWQPSSKFGSSSPDGLGRTLADLIEADPCGFAEVAVQFKVVHPTYVRSLFEGLSKAVQQKHPFPWNDILALAKWVVAQPREDINVDIPESRDPGWGWTRKAIAHLISDGMDKKCIPIEMRREVWAILQVLAEDPDPSPESDKEWPINTVRGTAIVAVIKYAVWLYEDTNKSDTANCLATGFGEMPEAQAVLDAHLQPTNDPSPIIHSVYGVFLPQLWALDKEWVANHISGIFIRDEGYRDLRRSAWDLYIRFSDAYDVLFDLLVDDYLWAIACLTPDNAEEESSRKLGEHLMEFYWRGKIPIDGNIMQQFFSQAPIKVRHSAIAFVGHRLSNIEGAHVSENILRRLRLLWEWRLAQNVTGTAGDELRAFGWWYASGYFDDHWALCQIKETFRIVGRVDVTHKVLARLSANISVNATHVIECLQYMVEGIDDPSVLRRWHREIINVISEVLQSTDKDAKCSARELVNRLLARGWTEYRELLG